MMMRCTDKEYVEFTNLLLDIGRLHTELIQADVNLIQIQYQQAADQESCKKAAFYHGNEFVKLSFEFRSRIIEDHSIVSIFNRFSGGSWLDVFARLMASARSIGTLFKSLKLRFEVSKRERETLRSVEKELKNFEEYVSITRDLVRNSLTQEEKLRFRLAFNIENGSVKIGNEIRCRLEPKSPEYCWFKFLFETSNFATFSEAQKEFPTQLESSVSTRLKKKINQQIGEDTIIVAEPKNRGFAIDPKYDRVTTRG